MGMASLFSRTSVEEGCVKVSAQDILNFFSPKETICMKFQGLFFGKIKVFSICRKLNQPRVVKVKNKDICSSYNSYTEHNFF